MWARVVPPHSAEGRCAESRLKCDWRPVDMAPIRGSDQKKLPPEGKGRRGGGMSGISCVGGVGRSQTREGKGVSGRGRSIVLEGTEVGSRVALGN